MTNDSHGGAPADETCFDDWSEFESLLAGYVANMLDPDGRDHLILELPGDDESGTAPYAQFAGFGSGTMLRGEISSNTYLGRSFLLDERGRLLLEDAGFTLQHDHAGDPLNWASDRPVGEAVALASQVVFALRDVFGIPHPHLLTCQAWGPAAASVGGLGLSPSDEVPADVIPPPANSDYRRRQKTAYKPKTREKLVQLVGSVIRDKYDGEPVIDEDGDYVLGHMDQRVWVRVRADQPAIEIMARVVHEVRSRRGTAVEIGILNRDHAWAKWELRERAVWQRLLVPGFPFVPVHLDAMLDVFLTAMTTTRDDLALRVGGRTA
ncbi:T3SS (YopN, CesT) and YbjN peptide-binding chaperone 1 [Nocardioides sp. CPCC 206347]|uniref:T3SS (YopN, CesT) and YbjN peptide-binding chaperone 1 n=2 Tax=Nocardioides TaxID=1839 RepID=UPI003B427BCF